MFSTARLIENPVTPVSNPTKQAKVHFKNMYCKMLPLVCDRQSCLKISFSTTLKNNKIKQHKYTCIAVRKNNYPRNNAQINVMRKKKYKEVNKKIKNESLN